MSVRTGQGFVNLNFERANLSAYGSEKEIEIPATNGIPGWTAYSDGVALDDIVLNGQSLGGGEVNIDGTNNPTGFAPDQGNYFVFLQGGFYDTGTAAIGQTGTIPANALSLIFWGSSHNMVITFNGLPLSFAILGNTANYTIYGADISAYAGQTGQLLFTALDGEEIVPPNYPEYGGSGIIDNIQFSSSPVPEPNKSVLACLGGILLASRLAGIKRQT